MIRTWFTIFQQTLLPRLWCSYFPAARSRAHEASTGVGTSKRKNRRRLPRADAMTVDGGFDSRVNLRRRDTDCRRRLQTPKAGTPKQPCHIKTTPRSMSQLAPPMTPDAPCPPSQCCKKKRGRNGRPQDATLRMGLPGAHGKVLLSASAPPNARGRLRQEQNIAAGAACARK